MVWYGMVWYGMVWYGMVWYGMVWYGMVWYGMVWLWYGMGMVWYGMKRKILINTDADERASGPAFPCDVSESTYMHLCRLLQRVHYRLLVALACGRHLLQRQTQTEASEIFVPSTSPTSVYPRAKWRGSTCNDIPPYDMLAETR